MCTPGPICNCDGSVGGTVKITQVIPKKLICVHKKKEEAPAPEEEDEYGWFVETFSPA